MRIIKKIIKVLGLAAILTGVGQFLPVFSVLYDNYLIGFLLTVVAVLISSILYKSYMTRVAKLPSDVRDKRENESQKGWDETCEATFSLSEPLDLRNMTNDD